MQSTTPPTTGPADHSAAAQPDDALFRTITWRLVPLLFVCYVFNYLDRTNVGYAQLQMRDQLGFGDAVFGLGAGIFFLGYALFEVPSNLLLARVGIRRTLLRIMALWGLASAAMAWVSTPTQFYVLRFLVGVFEAGFAPGVLFYLTLWFPARRRAEVTALFFMAFAAAPIVAGPVAGLVMTYLDGALGWRGWQWLFLLEGLPTVLLGVAAWAWLPDSPAQAAWLSAPQRQRLQRLLDADQAPGAADDDVGRTLRDGRVWLLGFMAFLVVMAVYALTFWKPTLLTSMGLSVLQVGLLSAIPATVGVASMVWVGRRSDRMHERRWHFALPALGGAVGLVLTALATHSVALALLGLSLATAGLSAAFTVLWAVPGGFLSRRAAAAGIALISTISACGGLVAPLMVGVVRTATGGFALSLYLLAGALVLAALLMRFALPASALPAQRSMGDGVGAVRSRS